MAKRNEKGPVSPNAPVPEGAEHSARSEFPDQDSFDADESTRAFDQTEAHGLDDAMTMQEADARREVPRLRTDSINPRKDRKLPGPDVERGYLSSRMKKDYSKSKNAWIDNLPKTRRRALNNTLRNPTRLEDVNRALRTVTGSKSELPPSVRRRVEANDRAIRDFEAKNERGHIVYSSLLAPNDTPDARDELRKRLRSMIDGDSDQKTLAFDGYIPATHSLGNVAESDDLVLELRTKSGAYIGTSDSTPNADHIVGRGRHFAPVAMYDVSYVKPDGSTGTRTIVQATDVTDDGRTVAK